MEGKRGSECLLKSVSNIDFNPQSQETISDILEDAWQNAKIVAVQIGTPYDDRLLPDIEGAVIGHWDDQVYLQLKNGDTQSINVADIRNVALLNPDRWWALA